MRFTYINLHCYNLVHDLKIVHWKSVPLDTLQQENVLPGIALLCGCLYSLDWTTGLGLLD